MKRIFLIDAPGVVPPSDRDTPKELLMRGVVRVENVGQPEGYVAAVLARCEWRHVERTYEVRGWRDEWGFLEALARKMGKLCKGGEADTGTVAKMVLNDFIRGKIPWFVPPPGFEDAKREQSQARDSVAEIGPSEYQERSDSAENHERTRKSAMLQLNKTPTANLRSKKRKKAVEDADEGHDGKGEQSQSNSAEDAVSESQQDSDRGVALSNSDAEDRDDFNFSSEEEEDEENEVTAAQNEAWSK